MDKQSHIIKFNLNDYEMNNLEYNDAIKLDKRAFIEYYISLLKKKHLILFAFIPINDYNLNSIKISLFWLSFSSYYATNGLFFDDKTMHIVYKDEKEYNIIIQISIILYSSLISSTLNILLRVLALSEKNILSIKKEKKIKNFLQKSKEVRKSLNIKFIIYFILGHIIVFFFWFFISCFCVIYINTSIILLKDTLISFGISMLYPFGLNLFPAIFRIQALRAKKRNKEYLYLFSKYLALV